MFEKTRIRFNSYVFTTLAIVILKVPYIHERDTSILVYPNSYDRRRKDITIRWTHLET